MDGAARTELSAVRRSLQDLVDAANPALLAGIAGMSLGDEYLVRLQNSLAHAKSILKGRQR